MEQELPVAVKIARKVPTLFPRFKPYACSEQIKSKFAGKLLRVSIVNRNITKISVKILMIICGPWF